VKVADEIDLEMCSYGQLSELQMVRDLDLDLDGVKVTPTYTLRVAHSRLPNRVTVASRTTEIWQFEYREITTLDEV